MNLSSTSAALTEFGLYFDVRHRALRAAKCVLDMVMQRTAISQFDDDICFVFANSGIGNRFHAVSGHLQSGAVFGDELDSDANEAFELDK